MKYIKIACKYLYNSLNIPIYVLNGDKLAFSFPDNEIAFLPPKKYINSLISINKKVTYVFTELSSFLGNIKIYNTNYNIIFGPVSTIKYTKKNLFLLKKEYDITNTKANDFDNFIDNIPTDTIESFINMLLLINFVINNNSLKKEDVFDLTYDKKNNLIEKKYAESLFISHENNELNNTYELEKELYKIVETGNIKKLKQFETTEYNLKSGKVANSNLRHYKNLFIISIALCARAAIKGGLSHNIAYQLSDVYIKQVENLNDLKKIYQLQYKAIEDYTQRIANNRIPKNIDSNIMNVIEYIHVNIDKNIKVSDISEYIGFNRSYLSHKFKKDLGIDLSSYIMNCKLEEAEYLLTNTDKSISEISNFLSFSSQSHFQKAFKKKYTIPPHAYRTSHY